MATKMESPQTHYVCVDASGDEERNVVTTTTTKTVAFAPNTAPELLAKGSHVLHEHVVTRMEAALGRAMPQMEIRFRDLAITADLIVKSSTADNDDENASVSSSQLPTLPNEIKTVFRGLRAAKHVEKKHILQPISGVLKPGTMTLVLGQPGSGKSSLLKMLSGRFPVQSTAVQIEGEITYNGKPQRDVLRQLPQFVAYVTQHDQHFGSLTVKETFEYAHKFSGTSLPRHSRELLHQRGSTQQADDAHDAVASLFAHYPEIVLHQLGLENCQDTMIGDAMTRGVSGGEKKRVTLGEMEFGLKYVTLMDEISTGLDSAATYDIVKTQRSIADTFKKTIVMSLLQPGPEVFAMFDNVLLLNQGHVLYNGPRTEVVPYFAKKGLVCPPHRDIADFLMDLGTSQQVQYERKPPLSSSLSDRAIPRLASQFGELYKSSSVYSAILASLDEPQDSALLQDVQDHLDPMPQFQQSYWANTRTLFGRQMKIALRNKPFLMGRAIMVLVMGMLYSSVFFQFDARNVQVVMGTVFASVLFLTLGQFSALPSMMTAREIFYKQRRANFIRTSSYVVSSLGSQLPLAVVETLVFGSMMYWMCGFASSLLAFANFEVLLLLTNLCFTAWFMVISAWAPDLHVVEPVGLVTLLFFILFAGFVIFKSQMASYLVWLYWIDPMAWSVRAVAVNEYRAPNHDTCEYKGRDYCLLTGGAMNMGEYYLSLYDMQTEKYWIYYGMLYLVGSTLVFLVIAWFFLEFRRQETAEHHGGGGAHTSASSSLSNQEQEQNGEQDQASPTKLPTQQPTATPYGELQSPQPTQTAIDVSVSRGNNFVPVQLAFQDLRYSVPDPQNPKQSIELLKGISGYALPGSVTALMGASGAGKTTLMDVIAGRKTGGTIRGSILINGYSATDLVIRRATGYCEQVDVHLESATFREALTFSAFLRQSSDIADATKYDTVNECLELLDLGGIADRVVRGSTIEQRKRLTIGVELAAQPSVLFLDEPTSGLDARSAKVIMDGVRKVADSGRTIVCTIHQPSAEVFYVFDSLLLLKKGGETVFYGALGPNCRSLVEYFEGIPGVKPLPVGYNPATWMLECIGAGVSNAVTAEVDFVEYFQTSPQYQLLVTAMDQDGVLKPSPLTPELTFASKRAATATTQFQFLLQRSFRLYWRTASYNLTRFVISLCLALLFWLVFGGAEYESYQGMNSGLGMVFLTSLFNGIVSFNSVLPIAHEERNAFYRERASQTYNAFWYFLGSTIVEIPYVFVSGLLFTIVFFPAVGFTGFTTGVLYWINVSMLVLMQTYFGQLLAYALPTVEVAAIIGVLLNSVFFLFMGFVPPSSLLPSGYKWMYYATPQRYPFAILSALVFSDCELDPVIDQTSGRVLVPGGEKLGCKVLANTPVDLGTITVKGFTENVFKMKYDEIWPNFAAMVGFILLFRLLGLLALRFINHQKR